MRRFERRHVGAIPAGGTNIKTACSSGASPAADNI
jgi:hypothetical protein